MIDLYVKDIRNALENKCYFAALSLALRSINVRAINLVSADCGIQLDLFNERDDIKLEQREKVVDELRARFGHFIIGRASLMKDDKLTHFNPKGDHTIHPMAYFRKKASA